MQCMDTFLPICKYLIVSAKFSIQLIQELSNTKRHADRGLSDRAVCQEAGKLKGLLPGDLGILDRPR
jgi:hypothetical protein